MSTSATTTRTRGVNPRNLRKGGAEAGVLTGSGTGEGAASLVEIAVWNEFGTKWPDGTTHVPARPAFRQAIDKNSDDWRSIVRRINALVLAGKLDNETACGILGAQIQADIQKSIIDLEDPPNAQATIDKKGSANPLIDTGAYKDSIKWQALNG